MTADAKLELARVNVRIKISALQTSMPFIFAYVDLFSLYRPDFRADVKADEVAGFGFGEDAKESCVERSAISRGKWGDEAIGVRASSGQPLGSNRRSARRPP
jgi:hypothetical protein